ncbi:MAG: UDP-N-acetylmuramoyl-tripeptide--D-alanyl-D-alanine ligase [Flavobacteriaceae bacterium]|nr:UDP-N-acetylmuramoyl-tripeptide--D-alanyl-D-alanine ligase [Flavobacteriaceae bacterium]
MNVNSLYNIFLKNPSVSIDSRNISKDDIFFAIKGPNFDGNKFAMEALHNGASFVISDNKRISDRSDKIIYVNNSTKTLQNLANYHRKKLKTKIIAITGSNGKTTTKELLFNILKNNFKTIATKGNLNNHLGVPLTLLSISNETEIGIVEMGANHKKEIEFLCNIAEPDYGYITNFGKAHLEGFGSLEGVIQGKSELYDYLRDNNKLIFYDYSNSKQCSIIGNYANKYSFGKSTNSNCIINKIDNSSNISVEFKNKTISSSIYGNYNYQNICASICISDYFKISVDFIIKGIESYIPQNNRSEKLIQNSNEIILDAYNANPTSMELSINSFTKIKTKNKIIIVGDMFELGIEAIGYHQLIVDQLEKIKNTKIYIIGSIFNQTNFSKNIISFKLLKELIIHLKQQNFKNSTVLIKGSRGMEMESIVDIF